MTHESQSLRAWLAQATQALHGAGIDQADADASWIACHVLGLTRGELHLIAATRDEALGDDILTALEDLLSRRLSREPLWHILGRAPFMGMEFDVGPGVFTPRPETELLAHMAMTELMAIESPTGSLTVCDVGAGSGALGLAIAQEVPHATVVSIEPSADAREYLAANVARYGDGRVSVVDSTASDAPAHIEKASLDMVVSNPPYLIRDTDWVDPETRGYDPEEALFADDEGLAVVREVVAFAGHSLRPGGLLLLEHGISHDHPIAEILSAGGFTRITHHNDMTGRPRFTRASKL